MFSLLRSISVKNVLKLFMLNFFVLDGKNESRKDTIHTDSIIYKLMSINKSFIFISS